MEENGFNITIHRAYCCGNDKNCVYQYPVTIITEEDFREAVKYDHVYFDFHNNYRSIKNFTGMMQNGTFRGRGLTARFLYCMPQSSVGTRRYRSEPVPEEVYRNYESLL